MTVQTKAPESQFAYVVLAARRAPAVMAGATAAEIANGLKATRIAAKRFTSGLMNTTSPSPGATRKRKASMRRR